MTADRRHPVIPFDATRIADFLDGQHLLSATLLGDGRSNTTYKLVLDTGQTFVLRMYASGSPEREAYAMNLARSLVPFPQEVHRGDGWAIFTFIEGIPLANAPEHCAAASEALAAIASITFDASGFLDADGTITAFPFDGAAGFIADMLDTPTVTAWLDAPTREGLRHMLDREAPLFAELATDHRLVHGDFNPHNILVHDGRVTAVLDWEFAHAGTPYMDIGNLLRHLPAHLHPRVRTGLEAGGMQLPTDWHERAALMDLTSQLEFLTTERSDVFKRACVDRVQGFLRKYAEPPKTSSPC
jgi:aminoglycoside phosphotransferase (APT) family kinase protein